MSGLDFVRLEQQIMSVRARLQVLAQDSPEAQAVRKHLEELNATWRESV